ncbi:MAG: hypothetical protein ABS41_07415 [Arenimonas sp. SCN 70-307]|nr:MAG: hypothetical protein ABS41_07415 [Arenimonas sp. SCN 70-307]
MDQRTHAYLGQLCLQCIALRMPHHEQVPSGLRPRRHFRQQQISHCQPIKILARDCRTTRIPFVQTLQLDSQHCRLDRIQTAVVALHLVNVFHARAVITQHADTVRDFWIVGGDRATIT